MKKASAQIETNDPLEVARPAAATETGFAGKMARGAAWMLSFKIIDRIVGVVCTTILTRLLAPEDFGLVSLAASVIAILELIGAFGLESALVQRPNTTRDHFDAVWSFTVGFGLCLGLLVATIAVPTAKFYGDPRLVATMLMIGLRQAIAVIDSRGGNLIVDARRSRACEQSLNYQRRSHAKRSALTTLNGIANSHPSSRGSGINRSCRELQHGGGSRRSCEWFRCSLRSIVKNRTPSGENLANPIANRRS